MRSFKFFIAGIGVFGLCAHVAALEVTEMVGSVEISVYAPDWTWQKRDINILFVLRNTGDATANVSLELRPPKGIEDHFAYGHAEEDESDEDALSYPRAEVSVRSLVSGSKTEF